MAKLVLFSDLHLDAQFARLGAHPDAARRRRQALRTTLSRIVQLAADLKADALLCGGDLYEHDRVSPDTAQFLRTTFAQLDPLPVYIAPGNHDWCGPHSLYQRTEWSPNVHVFATEQLEPRTLADGLTLWGAAHCRPAKSDGFLEGFSVDRAGVHLALFHGSELGWLNEQGEGKSAHAPFRADEIERSGLHHVLLGHYHRSCAAPRHTYPGNPDPLQFGEDAERGAVVFTVLDDGSVSREWRRVAVSQVHDVSIDISGCASQEDIRRCVAEQLAGLEGAVRATLHGELARELALDVRGLDDLATHLDGLVIRMGDVRLAYDLEAIKQEATVRGQFVRDVLAAHLPEVERRRVLLTGLRALEGRDDLEVA